MSDDIHDTAFSQPFASFDEAQDWQVWSTVSSTHPLSISLSAAVPLHILELYEGGIITRRQIEEAQAFGRVLAEHGDKLLYGSATEDGEVASLFNQLAHALAIMSFLPEGVRIFNQHFDAQRLLTAFVGEEMATDFCRQVWHEM